MSRRKPTPSLPGDVIDQLTQVMYNVHPQVRNLLPTDDLRAEAKSIVEAADPKIMIESMHCPFCAAKFAKVAEGADLAHVSLREFFGLHLDGCRKQKMVKIPTSTTRGQSEDTSILEIMLGRSGGKFLASTNVNGRRIARDLIMKSPLRGSYDMMKLLCPFCLEPFEKAHARHQSLSAGGDLYITEHIEHCDGRPGSWVPGASTWNQPYYAAQASVGYGLMAATSMLMGGFAPSPIFGAKPSYGATPPGSQNDPIKETLTPDLIEPIIGWRFWRVDKLGRLMSMNGGKNASIAPRWAGREPLVAECNVGADKHPQHGISPSENCTCGIYSSNTLETLFDYIEDLESAATLFGRTRNWGKVIRHQTGIRSQYSYPESIYAVGVPDTDRADQLSIVEQRYGIPVTILARKGDAYRLAVEEHLDAKTTDPKLTWLKKEDDGTYPNDPRSNA